MAENWIIPCNTKIYDIVEHFKYQNCVIWKNSFTIHKGDTAYLYLSAPFSEIKYKCIVVSEDVDEVTLLQNSYAIPAQKSKNYFSRKEKYIKMQIIREFAPGTFPLATLRANGLGQVQIQARTDRRLQQYITSIESKL